MVLTIPLKVHVVSRSSLTTATATPRIYLQEFPARVIFLSSSARGRSLEDVGGVYIKLREEGLIFIVLIYETMPTCAFTIFPSTQSFQFCLYI